MTDAQISESVHRALAGVPDPEIPSCSVLDLGILEGVEVEGLRVTVTLLPTFAGCPALDVIRADVLKAVSAELPDNEVNVEFTFSIPWTTDRISEQGRMSMKTIGIAPPGARSLSLLPIGTDAPAGTCPYCDSNETEMTSMFGPTPCRAVAYCRACRNPFEPFKRKQSR